VTSPFDYKGQPSKYGKELQKNRQRAYRTSVISVPPNQSLLNPKTEAAAKHNLYFSKRQHFDFGEK